MRRTLLLLAIAGCVALPTVAQTQEAPADATGVHDKQRSAFGQVMSVLTDLLQEGADMETTGTPSAIARTLSSEQSAVTITVTPVAGRSTFFVNHPGRGKSVHDDATRSPVSAVTAIDADAANAALAIQAGANVPD